MALTAEQLAQEKANEAKLNQLSDQIIGKTPFGQLYPLMKLAASVGEGAIPHKICVSADGREVKVYKGDAGKLVGAFLKPTHEYITMYLARKEYGQALASAFGLYGQLKSAQEQKKATCFTYTPNEIINLVKSVPSYDPNTGQRRASSSSPADANTPTTVTQQFLSKRNITITLSVVAGVGLFWGIIKLLKCA